MTILSADQLADTHPVLPDDWEREMASIRRGGGPWDCPACGGPSYLVYRCSRCSHDLAGEGSTAGRQGATR